MSGPWLYSGRDQASRSDVIPSQKKTTQPTIAKAIHSTPFPNGAAPAIWPLVFSVPFTATMTYAFPATA